MIGAEPGDLLGGEPAQAGPIIDEVEGVFQYATARIGETHPPTSPGFSPLSSSSSWTRAWQEERLS